MKAIHRHLTLSQWHTDGEITYTGYADTEALKKYLITFPYKIEGCFSAIVECERELIAYVDPIRSLPLFYAQEKGALYISDNPYWIEEQLPPQKFSSEHLVEYLYCGYVLGKETLHPKIFQLRAGEKLTFDKKAQTLLISDYILFQPARHQPADQIRLKAQWETKLEQMMERLIRSLDGRPVALPLSGGFDSRLLAILFKEHGISNVTCFSYGSQGNKEAETSRSVANKLGFPWQFVPYTPEENRELMTCGEFLSFKQFASRYTSLPHFQDYLAVKKLDFPKETIFIPGHSLDFLAGSHIPLHWSSSHPISRNQLVQTLINVHASLWSPQKLEKKHLLPKSFSKPYTPEFIDKLLEEYTHFPHAYYEYWDWRERQAKYIANSVRVYEFFGYEWRMPFWDISLIRFWQHVPFDLRKNKKLFDRYMLKKQKKYGFTEKRIRKTVKDQIKKTPLFPILKKIKQNMTHLSHRFSSPKDPLHFTQLVRPNTYKEISYPGISVVSLISYLEVKQILEACRTSSRQSSDERQLRRLF